MTSDLFARATALFERAIEQAVAERGAFVTAQCGDDHALRARVLAMLRADARGSALLDATPDNIAAALAPAPPRLIGRRVGPYVVRGIIGQGGMGIVCLAEREDVGKRVALKLVAGALGSPERVTRFLTERRLLAQLQHPNIVPLLDAGAEDDGTPWLAMEYVEGEAIDAHCTGLGLSLSERLALFERVCGAVAYAHRHLIVHRDLKPSNVLVGADGVPHLLDFGIAKLLADGRDASEATATGLSPMTPRYASPEQRRGAPVTTASDIYQLGALLYQLLTDTAPPSTNGRVTTGRAIPRPSSVTGRPAGGISPRLLARDLDVVVLKATEEDPSRRYRTVEELADDIRRHLDGRPILAHAPNAAYLARKFVGRHKVAAGVAGAALIALAAFAVIATIQNRRVERQRVRADAVATLLSDIFASADPSIAQGDSLTLRGVLDRGVRRLRADSVVTPDVRARLLRVVAQAYLNLGRTDDAIALESEALQLLDAAPDANDPERLATMSALAGWLVQTKDRARALALSDSAVRLARTLPVRRRGELASTLAANGFVRQASGDHDGARRDYEEALPTLRANGAVSRADLEKTLVNLGYLASTRGDLAAAETHFAEVFRLRSERLGPSNSQTAKAMLDLAGVLTRADRLDAADSLLSAAMAIVRRVYTAPHRDAMSGLTHMAQLHVRRGRLAAAESTQREVLEIARVIYGDSSVAVAMAVANLAGYVQRQSRLDEAAALHHDAVARLRSATGRRSVATAIAETNYAWTQHSRGRSGDADRLYELASPVLDSAWQGSSRLASILTDHAAALRVLNRCGAAEPLLRRALSLASTDRAPDHADVLRPMQFLGSCASTLGRHAEAESLLTLVHSRLLASLGKSNEYTIGAARELERIRGRR